MHDSTTRAAHAAASRTAIAAALLAVVALGGCGPAGAPAETQSQAPPPPTATSPRATPTASATPSPAATTAPTEATGERFETQNGTMRLQLPEGWVVTDQSRLGADLSGRPMWENMIDFRSPSGTQLGYYDGFGSNVGFIRTDFGVVEERPTQIADDVSAMSWWVQDSGRYFVHAAIATRSSEGTEPIPEFVLPGVERNHMFTMLLLDDAQPSVASVAEAEQLLGSAEVQAALDVMAGLELTGVDGSAMPPGVGP